MTTKNAAAQELGRKGGSVKSEKKANAARENAKKPRGRWMTAIAYELIDVPQHIAFGAVLAMGKPPADNAGMHEWVSKMLQKHGVGLQKMDHFKFGQFSLTSMKV